MAQRRMFNKSITNNDNFLEMPDSSQNLYFHLSMNADDDGFIDNWKSIMKMTGHKEDDLKILILKNFVIPFETGVIVIKHWRLNNYLQADRKLPTLYQNELKNLEVSKNGTYFEKSPKNKGLEPICIHSIDKSSIEKNNKYLCRVENNTDVINEIIEYVNKLGNTNFKTSTKKTRELINARIKDGCTLEDLKKLVYYSWDKYIKNKTDFNGTPSEYYYRPETIFNNKFEAKLEDYNRKANNERN